MTKRRLIYDTPEFRRANSAERQRPTASSAPPPAGADRSAPVPHGAPRRPELILFVCACLFSPVGPLRRPLKSFRRLKPGQRCQMFFSLLRLLTSCNKLGLYLNKAKRRALYNKCQPNCPSASRHGVIPARSPRRNWLGGHLDLTGYCFSENKQSPLLIR